MEKNKKGNGRMHPIYSCKICGLVKPIRYGKGHSNIYCSIKHYWQDRLSKHKCKICQKPCKKDKRGDRYWKFCSIECRKSYMAKFNIGKKCPHPFPKGKDNPMYIHGETEKRRIAMNSVEYSQWRLKVFARDIFKCVLCGSNKKIQADHIKEYSNYPDLRFELSNGRTLCYECHKKTENYGWKLMYKYYQKKYGTRGWKHLIKNDHSNWRYRS